MSSCTNNMVLNLELKLKLFGVLASISLSKEETTMSIETKMPNGLRLSKGFRT